MPCQKIRRQCCAAGLDRHPRQLIPARSRLPHGEQVELFVSNVEKEFGSVVRVVSAGEVPGAVADYLAAQNLAGKLVMAPHPELQAIDWSLRPLLEIREGRAESSDMVSVQHGFAAIAETGTLMLPSAAERPTTLEHIDRYRDRCAARIARCRRL